ncbi:MAG: 4-hydroxy-tetrahydrodipicolinate synthase [Cyclobacteriaceae bacterium]|nr:4-hydroxy-tetrahydrodipicolinate synthase [Cyclobacteriaceae bacterium]
MPKHSPDTTTIKGTGVALVTPFDKTGNIDFKGLSNVLTHTSKYVDYFVVMGTTAESVTLNKEERIQVLNFVKENNPEGLPIIYGMGGNNTAQILEDIKHTNLEGVFALLSVCPYYNKPSQRGLRHHFTEIANNSPIPIVLYNVPGRTSCNLTAETTLFLANHENIIGTKEASGNLEQVMNILLDKPEDFVVVSGDDLLTLPMLSIGAEGVISVLANAYPHYFSEMIAAFNSGNMAKAREQLYKFLKLNPLMYEESNPVGVKQLLSELGICEHFVRSPLYEASDELKSKISKLIK